MKNQPPNLPPSSTAPFFFFFPFYTLHTVKVAVRKYKAEVSVQPHHKQRAATKKKKQRTVKSESFRVTKSACFDHFGFNTLGELERDSERVCESEREREVM